MNDTNKTPPWSQPLTVADLPNKRATTFSIKPDAALRTRIADELGLRGLRKIVFDGEISANGKADWQFSAKLGATVVQNCIITLEPVVTRIDEVITRSYTASPPEYEAGSELEMPEDESNEQLGDIIDPGEVMIESLILALPQFPRTADAEIQENTFTEPGKTPMDDAEARPFSGLSALRDKLENGGE